MPEKPTIILDFDGVIHSYKSGWQGADVIPDPPVENVDRAIQALRKDYEVVVHSSRCHQEGGMEAIEEWLKEHEIEVDGVVRDKVPAVAIVDDRAVTFRGVWNEAMVEKIKSFKPWNRKGQSFKELKEMLRYEMLENGDLEIEKKD